MSFGDAVAAELEQVASRLLELHERAIAQVRREYRCTCARDPPQFPMHTTNPVRPTSPRGDECESLMLTIPAAEANEVEAKEEKTSANQEARPHFQESDLVEEISSLGAPIFRGPSAITMEKKYAVVRIDCAYNLRDADHMLGQGSSDPYCMCKVIGKAAAREFRTKTISDTLNPVWNHAEEFALDEDVSEYTLEFVVMDEDIGKSDDLLGRACLPLASCYPKGFNSCLALDEFGKAQVLVSVEFINDDCEQVTELIARSREQWVACNQNVPLVGTVSSFEFEESHFLRRTHDRITGRAVMDRFVVAPTAAIRLAWDVLSLVSIIFDAFTVPAVLAFDVKPTIGMMMATCIVTTYWTFDIFANFFTGFTEHGVVETRFKLIARKYVKGWFLVDFLVVLIDWVFIVVAFGTRSIVSPGNKVVKATRASRAIRILSLVRARKCSTYMPEIARQHSETIMIFSHIVERLLYVTMLTHCICCLWYAIGVADGETITWVQQRGIKSDGFMARYFISFDWALAQFTPSPTDTHPQNLRERTFKICVDFCGLVTFSAFVSTITSRMSRLGVLSAQKAEKDTQLWRYFRENRVPIHLTRRVLKAVGVRDKEQASLQTCERDLAVLHGLPDRLLQELRVEVKLPHCLAHPFFKFLYICDATALYEACHQYIQDSAVLRGHELFLRGAHSKYMIFITKGCILYRCRGMSVKVERGGWLSEASIWINGWIHCGDALASKLGHVMRLDAAQFQKLMMSRLGWPDFYTKGTDNFIKAYVRGFIEDGEAALRGTKVHLSCSDVWSEARQLDTHCSNAFKICGFTDNDAMQSPSRQHVSAYLRQEAITQSWSNRWSEGTKSLNTDAPR